MTFSLNGHACSAGILTVPGIGLWYASVDIADEVELEGAVTLKILDTTWSGTVIAGAAQDGASKYRIVAGAGGWGREVPARAYANDAGLAVAQLVTDVASEVSETTPALLPTTRLGPHFVRPAAPASFVLNLLAPRTWYAQADGAVAFGARPAGAAPKAPTVARNAEARVLTLALSDTAAGILPGVQTEYGAVADVEIEAGAEGLRARLYCAAALGRRAQAYAKIVAATDPGARFRSVWEYRVVSQAGERLNLQPVRSRPNMPDLSRVPVRAGVPGVKATHAPGSQVLVAFIDGDATRPAVVGFDDPDQPGWQPLSYEMGGPLALGVARATDPVQAGAFSGVIVSGSLRVKASL